MSRFSLPAWSGQCPGLAISRSLGVGTLLFLLLGPVATARAELYFPQPTVSLGKVKGGSPVAEEFTFMNRGKEPLEIVEIRPGCGCVTPELSKKVYGPGEEGKITLRVNTLGEAAGSHRWYLYLFYRVGEKERQAVLQVLAEVITEVTVQPAQVRIHAAGPITQEIRLVDLRPRPLTITKVCTSADFVEAAAGKPFRDEAGNWNVKIGLTLAGGITENASKAQVHIYTDDPDYRQLQVPVLITRPATNRIKAVPGEVKLFVSSGQAIPSRLVVIQDARGEEVLIEKIEANHPAIQCRWVKGPGAMATVKIQMDRDQMKEDRLESSIQIEVSGPEREHISIPVSCILE